MPDVVLNRTFSKANYMTNQVLRSTYDNYTKFYTDGSKSSLVGCVGYGLYSYELDLRENGALSSKYNIFETEFYGILIALSACQARKITHIAILTDSQTAIGAICHTGY